VTYHKMTVKKKKYLVVVITTTKMVKFGVKIFDGGFWSSFYQKKLIRLKLFFLSQFDFLLLKRYKWVD
jgi:hypothetical protein